MTTAATTALAELQFGSTVVKSPYHALTSAAGVLSVIGLWVLKKSL
jgi:hypothetical protein